MAPQGAAAAIRTAGVEASPLIDVQAAGSAVEAGTVRLLVTCSAPCRGQAFIETRKGSTRYGAQAFKLARGRREVRVCRTRQW